MGEGRTSNSKDIMLQYQMMQFRTPATAGPTTSETSAAACVPATAWTRARAWTLLTVTATASNIRNTCNSMGTNNNIDMGKSMDTSKSIDISNSRVTIISKDACNSRKRTTEMLKIKL
jgi:hypothetical protein